MARLNQKRKRISSSDSEMNDQILDQIQTRSKSKIWDPSIKQVKTIDDIITIVNEWSSYQRYLERYNSNNKNKRRKITFTEIEYDRLKLIIPDLKKLNSMVGMENLKKSIVEQILYFVQNLHGNEMMNIVLTGDPGTGKTTVGKILGNIYSKLGILYSDEDEYYDDEPVFKIVSRTDLIASYLGQTAKKTKKVLESCLGGVVFIDEAYEIGTNPDDKDTYSKECVDTLNRFLSEHRNIICIIAGYEDSIRNRFFSMNRGLERRFPWRFKMDRYTGKNLKDIFYFRIKEDDWTYSFDDKKIIESFNYNRNRFTQNGGDCEVLLNKCKIEHGKRIFMLSEPNKRKQRFCFVMQDFNNGLEEFLKTKPYPSQSLMYI